MIQNNFVYEGYLQKLALEDEMARFEDDSTILIIISRKAVK